MSDNESTIKLRDDLDYLVHDGKIVSQIHPTKHIQFAQIGTFLRLPRLADIKDTVSNIDIAVIGIPFDNGCSWKSGARFGPTSIREQSRILEYPFEQVQVCDAGDISVTPYNIDAAMKQMYSGISSVLKRLHCKIAVMGGDHTLSFPMLHALHDYYGRRITLVHFDAHLDTYDKSMDQDVWHGSPFRKAFELGLIDTEHSMHVGVREHCGNSQEFEQSRNMGYTCVTTEQIHENGVQWTFDQIKKRLGCVGKNVNVKERRLVYLSVDVDVLDPSVAPGTGTPECGGIFSHQMFALIRKMKSLAQEIDIVGCDLVEVSPAWDNKANITGLAGAHLLFQMMSLMEDNIVKTRKKDVNRILSKL